MIKYWGGAPGWWSLGGRANIHPCYCNNRSLHSFIGIIKHSSYEHAAFLLDFYRAGGKTEVTSLVDQTFFSGGVMVETRLAASSAVNPTTVKTELQPDQNRILNRSLDGMSENPVLDRSATLSDCKFSSGSRTYRQRHWDQSQSSRYWGFAGYSGL